MKLKPIRVGIVIVIAAALRSIFLNTRGIIYDDAFSIFLSKQNLPDIIRGTAADTMPPLYYFLLHFWMVGGDALWYLRLLSLIISVAGVLLIYLIMSDLIDERSALIAAVLASISPLQIYHAQDIRMYALLQAGQLGFVWCFVRIWKAKAGQNNSGYWAGLIFSGTIAMYSHNLAGFVLVGPALFLALEKKWKLLVKMMGAYCAVGILFLPWALQLPGQFNKIQNAFWTPKPGITEIFQVLIQFTANLPLPNIYWIGVASVLTLQIVVFLAIESRRIKGKKDDQLFLVVMIISAPILTLIVSYLVRPIFLARGFLACCMFFYGFGGWVISKRWKTFIGYALLVGFVASELMGLPYQLTYNLFPRSPFQEAGLYLESKMGEGITIIHDNKLSYFPTQFFAPNLKESFLADTPGSPNDTLAPQTQEALSMYPEKDIKTAAGQSSEIYFVLFDQTLAEYQSMNENHPALAWLDQHYASRHIDHINDLAIYHYSQRR